VLYAVKGQSLVGASSKRDKYLKGKHHSVQISFSNPVGFSYLNRKSGLRVTIELDSFADFEDGEKTLRALEKLYLRAIYYNDPHYQS